MLEMIEVDGIVSERKLPGYSSHIKKVTVSKCPYCGGTHVHYRGIFDEDGSTMIREAMCFKGDYRIVTD